jgi:uncharacterized protein (TIGR02284 family)
MNNIDTITLLNRLIVASKDGESSLRAAAEEAYHTELKESLFAYSRFFGDAAREMQEAVHELGGVPRALGTFGNTLHRTWLHLRASAMSHDEDVILEEVEGDENAVESGLARAIREETPPKIHELLERRYEGARQHHGQIRELQQQLHTH